jgi:hypothetical protein
MSDIKVKITNGCPVCKGVSKHKELFVKTGQDGFGTVDGYYVKCELTNYPIEHEANI